LNKPPTDIKEEAAREVEVNVNIGENNNELERGKYKLPNTENNDDHIDV
jgi:hypothetical protein